MPEFRGLSLPVQDFHHIVTERDRSRKLAEPFRRTLPYQRPLAGVHGAAGAPVTVPRTRFHLHKNQASPVPAHDVQLPAPDGTPVSP